MQGKQRKTEGLIQELLDIYEKGLLNKWEITPPKPQGLGDGFTPNPLVRKKSLQRISTFAPNQKDIFSSLQQLEQLRGRALLYPYLGSGRGKGVYVELLDGSVKMDLLGGVGVQILGHAHKGASASYLKGRSFGCVNAGTFVVKSGIWRTELQTG